MRVICSILVWPGVSWRLDSRSLEGLLLKCSDPIPFTMSRNTTLFLNPLFWMHMWPWVVNYHHNSPRELHPMIQRFDMQTDGTVRWPSSSFQHAATLLDNPCISCICCTGFLLWSKMRRYHFKIDLWKILVISAFSSNHYLYLRKLFEHAPWKIK